MDQFIDCAPVAAGGIGHNSLEKQFDAVERRLNETYRDLVARFAVLELGCGRVHQIENAEEAGLVTDFVAQCQVQIRMAEGAHKQEKSPFLRGGRTVDAFFKRRSERLESLIGGVLERLKAYYDRAIAERTAAHQAFIEAAEAEALRAEADVVEHRAKADRLAGAAASASERRRAADVLALADAAGERAREAMTRARTALTPMRIEGDYGAVAYLTHSWGFDVVDLNQVPRDYLVVNGEAVRAAIGKLGVRDIPGLRIFQSESLRVRGVS